MHFLNVHVLLLPGPFQPSHYKLTNQPSPPNFHRAIPTGSIGGVRAVCSQPTAESSLDGAGREILRQMGSTRYNLPPQRIPGARCTESILVSRPRRNIFSLRHGTLWNMTSTSPSKALLFGTLTKAFHTCLLTHHQVARAGHASTVVLSFFKPMASIICRPASISPTTTVAWEIFFILVLVLNLAMAIQTRTVGPTV